MSKKMIVKISLSLVILAGILAGLVLVKNNQDIREKAASTGDPIIGDVNNDGVVNMVDIGIVIDNYGSTNPSVARADVNNDGKVNIIDIGIVVDHYGQTQSSTPTPTPTPVQTSTPSSTNVSCSSLTGIERKFPCSPLTIGPMPEKPTSGSDAWDMFTTSLYPGTSGNGINERFSAVANPNGSGAVVRNQNLLSDGENHTTVGTARDLPNGTTECSAFRWLWKDTTEFNPVGWSLIWQLQMQGSPIVAISVDASNKTWFFKSRNGGDSGQNINLGPVQYGHWAYFVVCTHLASVPNGWTKVWYKDGGWPDVNASPTYERSGHTTYQGETGHNTIGLYAGGDVPGVSYYGYFDRYGRATTPQRAVNLAGNP